VEELNRRAIPGRGTLVILEDAAHIAAAAAADLLAAATAAAFPKVAATAAAFPKVAATSAAPRPFTLALAGGSTPRSLYQLLADAAGPYRARLPWERFHFFWGDERHVPPDHPDSNYRMAREAMLDRVPVAPTNVHRIAAELADARQAAAAYEQELRGFFGLPPKRAWPRFDYLLLGLGEEGHTASLFPGSPALDERERLVAAPWVEAHQTFRITLTPPALNHAARVVFLVSGAQKAAALREVLAGELRPHLYPAQVVQPDDGELLWLVDRAAASLL
jgi:6-phosphogluconolactonase